MKDSVELQKNIMSLKNRKIIAIVDTREQQPLPLRFPTQRKKLRAGDYSFLGGEEYFSVERKDINDLVACCTTERERFEWELHRLRGFFFARVFVIGSETAIKEHQYLSRARPESVMASMKAWEVRYRIPFIFASNPENAARQVEMYMYYAIRELTRVLNIMYTEYRKNENNENANQ